MVVKKRWTVTIESYFEKITYKNIKADTKKEAILKVIPRFYSKTDTSKLIVTDTTDTNHFDIELDIEVPWYENYLDERVIGRVEVRPV